MNEIQMMSNPDVLRVLARDRASDLQREVDAERLAHQYRGAALDPITRRELQDEFRQLQRRLKTTVVLVTHDLREACRLGDRLALLHEGELVQVGPASAFLQSPADHYVREFFLDAAAVDLPSKD